jgi:hypothetical protein
VACSDNFDEETLIMPIKREDFTHEDGAEVETASPPALPETSFEEEDRAITRGLMILSERVLTRVFENEPDIYTLEDLKIRF